MTLGLSIIKNAENVGVCVKTSFYMRHKVLDCIRVFMGVGNNFNASHTNRQARVSQTAATYTK